MASEPKPEVDLDAPEVEDPSDSPPNEAYDEMADDRPEQSNDQAARPYRR